LRSALATDEPFTYRSVFIFGILKGFYNMGLGAFLERVWENLGMFLVAIPGSLLSFVDLQRILPGPVFSIVSIFIFLTVLSGFVYRLSSERGVMDFYVVFYLSAIAIWPVYGLGDARRYMIPLIPLFYYYSLTGFNLIFSLRHVLKGLRPGHVPVTGYILIPFVLFLALNIAEERDMFMPGTAVKRISRSVNLLKTDFFLSADEVRPETVLGGDFKETSPCYHDYLRSAYLLKELSGPGDVILTRKPELTALLTGRYALKFPFTDNTKALMRFIEGNGVDHILLDGCYFETRQYLVPFVNEYSERFKMWTADGRDTGILSYMGR
jgi:hypothetical protein